MPEHWLSRITDIFASKSDDLVELARVAGYDPGIFYRGTLTDDQIEHLLNPIEKHPRTAGVIHVTGDLGDAAAWLPNGSEIITARVRLFLNEVALIEAYLTDSLPKDVAAVLVSPMYADDGLATLASALEILQQHGGRPLIVLEGPIDKLKAAVPVLTNFTETSVRNGPYARLADDDIVTLDRHLRLVEVEKGRKPKRVTRDALSSVLFPERLGKIRISELAHVLSVQVKMLDMALSELARNRRRASIAPYVRMLLVLSKNVERIIEELSARDLLHHIKEMREDLQRLAELLRRAAATARRGGYLRSALIICNAEIRLLDNFRDAFSPVWAQQTAEAFVLMGDIRARADDYEAAAGDYAAAYDLVAYESHDWQTPDQATVIAEIAYKLALTSRTLERPDEEARYAELAVQAIRRADHVFAERAFLDLKAKVFMAKAYIDFNQGEFDAAIRGSDIAIEAYLMLRKGRNTGTISTKLGAAYAFKSEVLWRLDEHREGVLARVAAFHFGLQYLQGATTQRLGAAGLARLADDAKALRDYLLRISGWLHAGAANDGVLAAAWRTINSVEINPDIGADREWVTRVDRLRKELWQDLPRELMRQDIFDF